MAKYEILSTRLIGVGEVALVKFTADNGYEETQEYLNDKKLLQAALDSFTANAPEQKKIVLIDALPQA